jgi:acyl dehydratase
MNKLINKKVGAAVVSGMVVVAIVAGLTVTTIGQAVVFSVTDTQTVLEAKELKTKHIQSFGLGLE